MKNCFENVKIRCYSLSLPSSKTINSIIKFKLKQFSKNGRPHIHFDQLFERKSKRLKILGIRDHLKDYFVIKFNEVFTVENFIDNDYQVESGINELPPK